MGAQLSSFFFPARGRMDLSLSADLSTRNVFLKACEEGDLELVRVLLARGANVNWREEVDDLQSGLHIAAHRGDGDLLDLLLAQPGVEVNIKDSERSTPLMWACIFGKENVVRKLLQVDSIDLNYQDGDTALHWAARFPNPGCLKLLREAPGLKWNVKNVSGKTPLLVAASYGCSDILKIILTVPQPQLDLTVTDIAGSNVAWLAVQNNDNFADHQRCVQLLCDDSRVDWNTRDSATGNTPLLACLESGKVEMAKILLRNPRVDLNVQNDAGKFPETIAR